MTIVLAVLLVFLLLVIVGAVKITAWLLLLVLVAGLAVASLTRS